MTMQWLNNNKQQQQQIYNIYIKGQSEIYFHIDRFGSSPWLPCRKIHYLVGNDRHLTEKDSCFIDIILWCKISPRHIEFFVLCLAGQLWDCWCSNKNERGMTQQQLASSNNQQQPAVTTTSKRAKWNLLSHRQVWHLALTAMSKDLLFSRQWRTLDKKGFFQRILTKGFCNYGAWYSWHDNSGKGSHMRNELSFAR